MIAIVAALLLTGLWGKSCLEEEDDRLDDEDRDEDRDRVGHVAEERGHLDALALGDGT